MSIDMGKRLTLPAVPESIPIAKVRELIASLGIDIDQLTRRGVFIGWHTVAATIYATDPDGHRYLADGDTAAVHHISIRVDHGEDAE